MTETELRSALEYELQQSVLWTSDGIREEQQRNLSYYLGLPMGNEVEGRSQVVSWDVFEVVESAMPNFIEPFFASDYIGQFAPKGPEDEAFATQATEYVNHIVKEENDGFLIFNAWIKDALISKVGVVRADWCEQDPKRHRLQGLSTEQLTLLSQTPDVEIVEHEAVPVPGMPPVNEAQAIQTPPPMMHNVTILQKVVGKVEIENVKPENFIITRGCSRPNKARLIGEVVTYTRSELHEMGFKQAYDVDSFDDGSFFESGELESIRENGWTVPVMEDTSDKSQQEVRLFKGFIRADFNGDKVAEWRRVLVGGGEQPFLENEEAEYQNYCVISPIPVPHRVIGLAYADVAAEIQDTNTALERQYLDSLYLANNPRTYVNISAGVNMDDLLNQRIGGIVRGTQPASVAIQPLITTQVSRDALEGLEFGQQKRERRTGITRYNQGLDADSLNKTATGQKLIQGAGDKRQMMTLRIMAETGIRDLFRLVLRLVCEFQDRAKVARMRGSYVEFDPRQWSPDMDVTVDVGIGTGDKTETAGALREFGTFMAAAEQKGLVTPKEWHQFGLMMAKALGIKTADRQLILDPQTLPPPEDKPDPEMQKLQMQLQADAQKVQAQMQAKLQEVQANLELQQANDMRDAERERMKAEMQAQLQQQELSLKKYLGELEANVKLMIAGLKQQEQITPEAPLV